ncbi:MAG TPA: DUF4271 domain-containing protein [Chitinophagales bacterium]|nr:DUF4271 domain-containing protein [Chitinophagales bacterium]
MRTLISMHIFRICLAMLLFSTAGIAQSLIDTTTHRETSDTVQYDTVHSETVLMLQGDKNAAEIEIKPVTSVRHPGWLFWIFVLQLILIAYLRRVFPKSLPEIIRAVMNVTIAQQLYREQFLTMPLSAILYNVVFILSGGIFLFLLNDYYSWIHYDSQFITFLFFIWGVIVVYSIKYGLLKLVSIIFPFGAVIEQYNFNFFLVQKVLGLVLVPFNLLIAYAPEIIREAVILLALVAVALLIALRSIRGLVIAQNLIARNAFHFFVYICTLEISPVCILVKVVVDG